MSDDGGKWKCSVCTYSNASVATRCVMCNAEPPGEESGRTSPYSLARSVSESGQETPGDEPSRMKAPRFSSGRKAHVTASNSIARSNFEMGNAVVHSRAEPVTRPAPTLPRRCPTRTDIVDWVRELSLGGKIALACVIGTLLITAGFLIGFAYRKVDDNEVRARRCPHPCGPHCPLAARSWPARAPAAAHR